MDKPEHVKDNERFFITILEEKISEHEKLGRSNSTHQDLRIAHLTVALLLTDGVSVYF